jgi:hypothetical protein
MVPRAFSLLTVSLGFLFVPCCFPSWGFLVLRLFPIDSRYFPLFRAPLTTSLYFGLPRAFPFVVWWSSTGFALPFFSFSWFPRLPASPVSSGFPASPVSSGFPAFPFPVLCFDAFPLGVLFLLVSGSVVLGSVSPGFSVSLRASFLFLCADPLELFFPSFLCPPFSSLILLFSI